MDKIDYELLIRFYKKDCSEEERQLVMKWVNRSPENAEQFFKWEELYHLGRMPEHENDILLRKSEKKLMERLRAEERMARSYVSVHRWVRYVAVVIVVCALLGVLGWYWTAEQNQWLVAATGRGETLELVLPDSSRVWLNENTELKYPMKFADNERTLFLSGEAYFEVTKNKHQPFTVHGLTMDVQVLGTKFNFRNAVGNHLAEASLIEGEVKVKGHKGEGLITLSPGQKVTLNSLNCQMKVLETDVQLDAVWHDNLIPFKNADLFKIAQVLETLYGMEVILSPNINHKATYSGFIRRKDSVEDVLNILKGTMHLQYKINNGTIFITSNGK